MNPKSRTMTLRGGLSYTFGPITFIKDVPKIILEDNMLNRLLRTGLFEESPPLCYYFIRHKISSKLKIIQEINGDYFKISNEKPTKISRYQWESIKSSDRFEIVPPLEIMDELVKEKPNFNLLVSRDMGAGDVIIVTDVLWNLRQRYPESHITFATSEKYICLVDNLDFINEIAIIGDTDTESHDVSVNLCDWSESYPRCSQIHRSDMYGEAFSSDFPWVEHKVSLALKSGEKEWWQELNKRSNPSGKVSIAIQPYGSSAHRSIKSDAVNELIDKLIGEGFFVYVYGQDQWPNLFYDRDNLTVLWGKLSIREVVAIISGVDLIICPDSSGYHIAAAFDTPSVVCFTTVHEGVRVSYYPRCYPIRARELSCSPCWDKPCGVAENSKCTSRMSADKIFNVVMNYYSSGFPYVEHDKYLSSISLI